MDGVTGVVAVAENLIMFSAYRRKKTNPVEIEMADLRASKPNSGNANKLQSQF
jgi:hypothetical protein